MQARTPAQLEAALDHIRAAPRDAGTIELIVRRPSKGERQLLDEAELDLTLGVVGDRWAGKSAPDLESQVTVIATRAIDAVAERGQWSLAGDQFYVDLDLAEATLPAGARLALGSAVLEVSAKPHHGCSKFTARFGSEATRWMNSAIGRGLRLRGIHARVVVPGRVRRGDPMRRIS
jgi:MOSC domain-containing protein YiiM